MLITIRIRHLHKSRLWNFKKIKASMASISTAGAMLNHHCIWINSRLTSTVHLHNAFRFWGEIFSALLCLGRRILAWDAVPAHLLTPIMIVFRLYIPSYFNHTYKIAGSSCQEESCISASEALIVNYSLDSLHLLQVHLYMDDCSPLTPEQCSMHDWCFYPHYLPVNMSMRAVI